MKLTDGITNAQYVGGVDELVATGVITDNDNDSALPVISINNPRLSESGNQIFFRVNMSEAVTGETVDLTYVTSDGTAVAGSDYTAVTGDQPLQFASGEINKDIMINLTSDDIDEFDETFNVVLTLPSTTTNAELVGGGTTLMGTGTIVDDDAEPLLRLAANEVSADENDGKMEFTVNVLKVVGEGDEARLEATTSGKPISADIFTVDHRGEADRDADYTLAETNLTIPAGESSGKVTINLDRTDPKEDDEAFTLVLNNPVNATFGSGFPYLSGREQ